MLGAGFLERVYERALIRELAFRGVSAKAEVSFPVCYKGQYLGEYVADLVVEDKVIVELKCVDRLANEASGAMHQLSEGLQSAGGSAYQCPRTQGGVEARPPGPVSLSPGAQPGLVQLFRGHYTS